MPKFTKGNWQVFLSPEANFADRSEPEQQGGIAVVYVVDDKGKQLARVMAPTESELAPNARLIAAAPLLEGIARQFVRYCEQWQRANGQFPNGDGRILILKNAQEALALVENKEQ